MARPQPQEHWSEPQGAPAYTDWDSLRHDLKNLLRQVEGRQLLADPAPDRSHPHRPSDAHSRHQAALRSVQKAVERFSETHHDHAAPPQDDLQIAISQIRARTEMAAPDAPAGEDSYDAPAVADPYDGSGYDPLEPVRHDPRRPTDHAPGDDTAQAWQERPDPARRTSRPAGPVVHGYDHPAFAPHDLEAAFAPEPGAGPSLLPSRRTPMPAPTPEGNDEAIESLKRLTSAVSGMTGRLERLEADVQVTRDASGDIADIAAQVGQLTHVVELVAGAVGEQGQVKRLESQIADLARLYAEGGKPEIGALTRRIDELSATVDRLAALQVEEVGRAAREVEAAAISQTEAVRVQTEALEAQGTAMRAIEEGVRNIYDRIDALEHSTAITPEDFDRLTQEMGGITEALKHSGDAEILAGIIARLEVLSGQIDGMGRAGDAAISELRDDIQALSQAVRDVLEPRFAALESRLDSLTTKIDAAEPPPGPSFSEIEEQIRHLVQRMDQTGQQLDGLTELYRTESGRENGPDLQALAKLVAERTSQEMVRLRAADAGLGQTDLDALEARLSKLFAERQPVEAPGLLGDVADNLTRVDERLDRLETTLENLARQAEQPDMPPPAPSEHSFALSQTVPVFAPPPITTVKPPDAAAPEAGSAAPLPDRDETPTARSASPAPATKFAEPAPDRAAETPDEPEPAFSEPKSEPQTARTPQQADSMPHPPSADRPLVDDELSMLIAPVEDWSTIGFDEPPSQPKPQPDTARPAVLPSFDAAKVERPAPPRSSFAEDAVGFTPMGASEAGNFDSDDAEMPAPLTDRGTFIAAARRAVRSSQETRAKDEAPQSLFGRALARFQNTGKPEAAGPVEPPAAFLPETPEAPEAPEPPEAPEAPEPAPRGLPRGRATLEDFPEDINDKSFDEIGEGKSASFMARNGRSLVLAAALVATVILAANLIVQRLTPPITTRVTAVGTLEPEGTTLPDTLYDPNPTGSINPDIATDLSRTSPHRQILPSALTPEPLPGSSALDETFTHSVPPIDEPQPDPEPTPITLELPPESAGPMELRQAAADGDPRAQFEIGAIYTEGSAVPQDFKTAAIWYERAAAQGFAPAQYRLGNLFEHGNGIDKDLEQARLWYSRAAEAGNRMAMHNLASLYASGDLGEQHFAKAAEWFERAADTGMTDSQFNLGMLYARGLGVTQDLKASYKWFALAAEDGDKDAAMARDDIGRSLDADALKAAKAEVADWHMAPISIPANFAPIGTWSKDFDPGQTISDKSVTESVQRALARLGYDPGSVDGVMGPKTTQAIKEFEQATGMAPTGLVNPRLLAVLGSQPV